MSNLKTAPEGESFTSRLNIASAPTATYEELLDLHADTPRVVVCAVGDSGIGKTAIPKQVARKRGAPYVALHIPTMSIEDWHIPTTAADNKQYYDKRISRRLQPLFDYVKKVREENNGEFPLGKNPILAIEELNRAADKHVTRAAFVALDDRMIGDTHIDEAIQMVVTMNPSGGGMAVNDFEKDPAMRRRLTMVGTTVSYSDFIRYAKAQKFHPKVVEYLEAQPTSMYDKDAALAGKKFACPAAWETVSQVAYALERREKTFLSFMARAAFAGVIGMDMTERFLEFVEDKTVLIAPDEVLRGYLPKSSVRERFQKLVADGRHPNITALVQSLIVTIMEAKKKPATFGKQLATFLDDLPEETFGLYVYTTRDYVVQHPEANMYFGMLNEYMAQEKSFNQTMARLQELKAKIEREKQNKA